MIIASDSVFAQRKFKVELNAPSLINDTILLGPSSVAREGLEGVYKFKLDTSERIFDFGKKFGFEQCIYSVAVQKNNILEGEIDYPIPVTFQYLDPKTYTVYFSSTFFLDSGYYKTEFAKKIQFYEVRLNSPINNEYVNFKKLFTDLYIKVDGKLYDSLTDLKEKEKRVGEYIRKNPNSYVALWEIFDDYLKQDYYPVYLDNLALFSENLKKSRLYLKLENKLKLDSTSNKGNRYELEKSINTGAKFPPIKFDEQNGLDKTDFQKYKLTYVDCWSTGCGPCIKAMPEMVAMYNEYKNKGVNFISVTAESKPDRIKLAKEILKKKNVIWTNYFDINKDFQNKVGLTGYPLQFLIDQNGTIVTRVGGDLHAIKKAMDDYLK